MKNGRLTKEKTTVSLTQAKVETPTQIRRRPSPTMPLAWAGVAGHRTSIVSSCVRRTQIPGGQPRAI